MSRYRLVVDELLAVPSVNERMDVRVVKRVLIVSDSKINGVVSVDDMWAPLYIRRGKILEWFKLFS